MSKDIGGLLRPLLIIHKHSHYAVERVSRSNNILKSLDRFLEPRNACHFITTRATHKRQMKETLYTWHQNTVEPMMVEKDRKATLQTLHTDAVNKDVKNHERNVALDGRPPPISNSEKDLTRKERSTKIRILWTHGFLQEQNQDRCKPQRLSLQAAAWRLIFYTQIIGIQKISCICFN